MLSSTKTEFIYSPLLLSQISKDQQNYFELSVVWDNEIVYDYEQKGSFIDQSKEGIALCHFHLKS